MIQVELASHVSEMGTNEGASLMAQNVKFTVVFIAILPILVVYPFA
ncbi:hypothetical protein [Paenibacillus foliorum]|nr:hypothetical protein [Paenibacillus foliorum]